MSTLYACLWGIAEGTTGVRKGREREGKGKGGGGREEDGSGGNGAKDAGRTGGGGRRQEKQEAEMKTYLEKQAQPVPPPLGDEN